MKISGRLSNRRVFSVAAETATKTVAACRAAVPSRISLRSERGQSLLEFAFIFPIIMVFTFLFVDFGLAVDRREVLQHSVREGARSAAIGPPVADVVDVIVAQSQGLLDPADVTVCYIDMDGNGFAGDRGDSVRVAGEFTYDFSVGSDELLGFFGASLAPGIDMTPSAESRLERTIAVAPQC